MFDAVPMQKTRFIGLRKSLEPVLKRLQSEGIVELRECKEGPNPNSKDDGRLERLSREVLRLRGIKAALAPQSVAKPAAELDERALLEAAGRIRIDEELEKNKARLEWIGERNMELQTLNKTLTLLSAFGFDGSLLASKRYTVFLGEMQSKKCDQMVRTLQRISSKFSHKLLRRGDKYTSCLVICDAAAAQRFEYELAQLGFNRHVLDKVEGDTARQLAEVEAESAALKKEATEIPGMTGALSGPNFAQVAGLLEMLEAAFMREDAKSLMGGTEHVFVLEGWIMRRDFPRLKIMLEELTGNRVLFFAVETDETPPTVLNNPKALKPFETMVEFMSTPRSGEKDPTILFAAAFLLMYGLMLGDAGYGLMSLMLAYLIYRKSSGVLNDLTRLWMYASVPAMAFGVAFDEYFGLSHSAFIGAAVYSPLLRRVEDVDTLLLLALVVGVAHLITGYLMGYLNLRKHNKAHAAAKLFWICLILGGIALYASTSAPAYSFLTAPAAVVAVGAIIGIAKTEGILGLFELPGVLGNVLSYARIMAVGMASVAVAVIINQTFPLKFGLSLFITLPIVLLLHLANTGLGMFESSVQSARLNYAEFFTKFYEGGGRRFSPFRFNKVYTDTDGGN